MISSPSRFVTLRSSSLLHRGQTRISMSSIFKVMTPGFRMNQDLRDVQDFSG